MNRASAPPPLHRATRAPGTWNADRHDAIWLCGPLYRPDGLIYLLNRYCDPGTGQFVSVDPGLVQTQEPYAYGGGDPVINTDPRGDEWVFKGWMWGC